MTIVALRILGNETETHNCLRNSLGRNFGKSGDLTGMSAMGLSYREGLFPNAFGE